MIMNGNGNGNGNRSKARLTKWIPKKWELWHQQVVLLKSSGLSNIEIALLFKRTPQQISNILGSPQAAMVRKQVLEDCRKGAVEGISGRMEAIALKSVDRVEELIFDDGLFKESPFGVVDRCIKVLHGTGKMENEAKSSNTRIQNAVILTAEHSSELLDGLIREEQVKALHSGNKTGNVVHE